MEAYDRTEEMTRLFSGSRNLSPTLREDLQISDSSDSDETFEWEEPTGPKETVNNLNDTVDFTPDNEDSITPANNDDSQDNIIANIRECDSNQDEEPKTEDNNHSHTEDNHEYTDNGRQRQQFHYRYSKTTTYEGSCYIQ